MRLTKNIIVASANPHLIYKKQWRDFQRQQVAYWKREALAWLVLAEKWFCNERERLYCCERANNAFSKMELA